MKVILTNYITILLRIKCRKTCQNRWMLQVYSQFTYKGVNHVHSIFPHCFYIFRYIYTARHLSSFVKIVKSYVCTRATSSCAVKSKYSFNLNYSIIETPLVYKYIQTYAKIYFFYCVYSIKYFRGKSKNVLIHVLLYTISL